jgi:hypothetical protein
LVLLSRSQHRAIVLDDAYACRWHDLADGLVHGFLGFTDAYGFLAVLDDLLDRAVLLLDIPIRVDGLAE